MTPEQEKTARDTEDAATADSFEKARTSVSDLRVFTREQTASLKIAFDELEKALKSQQRRSDVRYQA